ncbi:MAG TPA: glycine--tRNA ligase subunit beta, partial [Gemmatimonadales bacterium]|nr:glycine--tRNA ligase subunit beta [Gemmatimonadales bacterium]
MGELLLEIGVEEVPAFLLRSTLDQLRDRAVDAFRAARLEATGVRSYGTPRRLVLSAVLPDRQQSLVTEVTGPPAAVAFDAAGQPTAAALGFAASQGVKVTDLQVVKTAKGDYVGVRVTQPALPTATVLKQLLPALMGQLQFPKTMHWHEGGQRFIRPLRWLVALFDNQVIPFVFANVSSGRRTVGHRALAPGAVTIARAADYRSRLWRACVLVDDDERRETIGQRVQARAKAFRASVIDEEAVTTQAVYSSEWPVVVDGEFDHAYLELPKELLVAVLEYQQGYFALHRERGQLLPRFLCVVDGGSRRNTAAPPPTMITGHERVLKARLEDARFYLKQDLSVTLSDRVATLKGVTFHEKLGSLHDKTTRLVELARWLAPQLGPQHPIDVKEAEQAARLSKADLVTGLVREFPELQGVIGGDYAARQGESSAVAAAIAEHYRPRFTGDALPASALGRLLSLADKVDTIIGYFGVGLAPTGSEDPYALRRQAAGVVQIAGLFPRLDLSGLLTQADHLLKNTKGWQGGTAQAVRKFLGQRLEWQLLSEGHGNELVSAVLAGGWNNPAGAQRWLGALEAILASPAGEDLLTVHRRVGRIVPAGFAGTLKPDQFTEAEERQLHEAFEAASREVAAAADEAAVLAALARLRPAVDAFFNKVMVMAKDQAVQTNRLALVNGIRRLFVPIADFSKISTASSSPAAAQA